MKRYVQEHRSPAQPCIECQTPGPGAISIYMGAARF